MRRPMPGSFHATAIRPALEEAGRRPLIRITRPSSDRASIRETDA